MIGSRVGRWCSTAALLAMMIVLSYCSDGSPTEVDDGSLESQIRSIFPAGPVRDDALSKLATIRQQVAANATASARVRVFELVDVTLTSFEAGQLTGGKSTATGNSVAKLVGGLYQLAGMDPPQIPDGSLGADGTAKVVGPAGGVVVTPSGAAGVVIPAGALPEQVVVTINQLPTTPTPGSGPLPTTLKQYPPYYDYATYPAVAQFGDSIRVGVCQVTDPSSPLYPPEPHERLRLAHGVGTTIQILDRVDVNDFLKCTGVSASRSVAREGWRALLASVTDRVRVMIQPTELYAAHGGLGGKVKSFSPFGAVDPGAPSLTNRLVTSAFTPCALDASGVASCWGEKFASGTGPIVAGDVVATPERVSTDLKFSALTAGSGIVCGVTSVGALHCWGDNQNAQYGYGPGDTATSFTPRPAAPGLTTTYASAGGIFMCGIQYSGSTLCWGQNAGGNLGNGDVSTFYSAPVRVSTSLSFTSVTAGFQHACGLTADGTAYCWGFALNGALGNGTTTNSGTPVPVSGGLKFRKIAAAFFYTCAIATDGAYCWGRNRFGNLGSDTGICTDQGGPNALCQSNVPLKVSGSQTFVDIAAGVRFACGLTAAGAAWCWGDNSFGELGNGTTSTTPNPTPVAVSGGLAFTTIGAGSGYACGATSDGVIYCWGQNNFSQIGQGSTATSFYSTPQRVSGLSLK
ncbi:MAG: RCC1 domain-containing protein [Gemmatimonadaceae bacterium]